MHINLHMLINAFSSAAGTGYKGYGAGGRATGGGSGISTPKANSQEQVVLQESMQPQDTV
jgi:hypothetical protein